MPKKAKSRSKNAMTQTVEVPFRVLTTLNGSFGSQTFAETDLTAPNLGARAAAIATTFEFFRLRRLRVYQYSSAVAATTLTGQNSSGATRGQHTLAFVESSAQVTGTPTTVTQMSQYEKYAAGNLFSRIGFVVPSRMLRANALKWFNTSSTGASSDTLSAGLVLQNLFCDNNTAITGGEAPQVTVVIEGIVEFQGYITPALQAVKPPAESKEQEESDSDCGSPPAEFIGDPTLMTAIAQISRALEFKGMRIPNWPNGGLKPPEKSASENP